MIPPGSPIAEIAPGISPDERPIPRGGLCLKTVVRPPGGGREATQDTTAQTVRHNWVARVLDRSGEGEWAARRPAGIGGNHGHHGVGSGVKGIRRRQRRQESLAWTKGFERSTAHWRLKRLGLSRMRWRPPVGACARRLALGRWRFPSLPKTVSTRPTRKSFLTHALRGEATNCASLERPLP